MDIDEDKIDDTALALLYPTLHEKSRVWKQIDWEVLNKLHEKRGIQFSAHIVYFVEFIK